MIDQAYFQEILNTQVTRANWVYEEMWTYWKKKHSHMQHDDLTRHWSVTKCDLLEVYCSENGQLTHQASK